MTEIEKVSNPVPEIYHSSFKQSEVLNYTQEKAEEAVQNVKSRYGEGYVEYVTTETIKPEQPQPEEQTVNTDTNLIPEQLQDWRFLLLCSGTKIPIAEEKDWDENKETKTFKFNNEKLLNHIKNKGNYGVVTGKDRFVIGADTKEIEKAIEERLPKTFTVMSPRHKTKHFYYYGEITKSITCKPSADGDPCADIKHGNAYILGPNSTFANYGQYKVIDDLPIATVTEDQVVAAIDEFISTKKPKKNKNAKETAKKHPDINFPIKSILPNLEGMAKNGDERKGPHPVHGSTSGSNFKIDEVKNVWYCWRHEARDAT